MKNIKRIISGCCAAAVMMSSVVVSVGAVEPTMANPNASNMNQGVNVMVDNNNNKINRLEENVAVIKEDAMQTIMEKTIKGIDDTTPQVQNTGKYMAKIKKKLTETKNELDKLLNSLNSIKEIVQPYCEESKRLRDQENVKSKTEELQKKCAETEKLVKDLKGKARKLKESINSIKKDVSGFKQYVDLDESCMKILEYNVRDLLILLKNQKQNKDSKNILSKFQEELVALNLKVNQFIKKSVDNAISSSEVGNIVTNTCTCNDKEVDIEDIQRNIGRYTSIYDGSIRLCNIDIRACFESVKKFEDECTILSRDYIGAFKSNINNCINALKNKSKNTNVEQNTEKNNSNNNNKKSNNKKLKKFIYKDNKTTKDNNNNSATMSNNNVIIKALSRDVDNIANKQQPNKEDDKNIDNKTTKSNINNNTNVEQNVNKNKKNNRKRNNKNKNNDIDNIYNCLDNIFNKENNKNSKKKKINKNKKDNDTNRWMFKILNIKDEDYNDDIYERIIDEWIFKNFNNDDNNNNYIYNRMLNVLNNK